MKSELISHRFRNGDQDARIAVVMPMIPPREANGHALRAISSLDRQRLLPLELHMAIDYDHQGAAVTRQRALDAVSDDAELVAFLDDDDEWYPGHLSTQYSLIKFGLDGNGADVAYSWFDGGDPFPMHRGRQWDRNDPHHITMTIMVKTGLAKAVGFRDQPGEDWVFIQGLNQLGARFAGTGEVTWTYHVHEGNTSGRGDRW